MRQQLAHLGDQGEPVLAGEVLVHEHAAEILALQDVGGLFRVGDAGHPQPLPGENALQDLHDDGFVVDDQDRVGKIHDVDADHLFPPGGAVIGCIPLSFGPATY